MARCRDAPPAGQSGRAAVRVEFPDDVGEWIAGRQSRRGSRRSVGATRTRSSGFSKPGTMPPAAWGTSAGWTCTGRCHQRASSAAEPEWSGWTWVSRIAAGRVPRPNSDSAADRIALAWPGHPASTSTHEDPDSTRYTFDASRHGPVRRQWTPAATGAVAELCAAVMTVPSPPKSEPGMRPPGWAIGHETVRRSSSAGGTLSADPGARRRSHAGRVETGRARGDEGPCRPALSRVTMPPWDRI